MNKKTGVAFVMVLAAAGVGCGEDDAAPGPAPADLEVAGTYEVVSTYDFTVGSVLPEPVATYAQTIAGLGSDPAGTLFRLLDEAGVPLVSDLFAALPDAVANEIKGWINEFFAKSVYGNASVKSELDALAAAIQTVLARPDVISQLQIAPPDANGAVTATHALQAVHYRLYDGKTELTVPITTPAGSAPVLTLRTTATGRVTGPLATEDAHLQVGDHAFGVAYGNVALAALDQALRARFGTDLRGALGQIVDCSGMAASVSNRCLLGACVGHRDALEAICDAGLDLAAQEVRDRLGGLRFDALRLTSGQAEMWDAPASDATADRRVDRLGTGTWAAKVDFGMGARDVHGTFTGTRVGN